jgi:hypothetical protein
MLNSITQAEEYFTKAKKFPTPYDFDSPIGLKISRGLAKLQRLKNETTKP